MWVCICQSMSDAGIFVDIFKKNQMFLMKLADQDLHSF